MAKYIFRNIYMERKKLTNSADKVIIKGSMLNRIYTKNGSDKVTVSSGMCLSNTIYGGDGNDTITINKKAYAHDTVIRGGAGKDKITVNGLQNGVRIYGEAGNDTITVSGEIRTKSGSSSYVSSFAGEYKIDGGNGADIITIKGGNDFVVSGGKGNDRIDVNGGQYHVIKGGAGNDRITVKDVKTLAGGVNNICDGGTGNDIITISNNATTVKGGTGNDTINIQRGSLHSIYTGSGSDTVSFFSSFTGVCTVYDYRAGDIFKFNKVGYKDYSITGSDVTLNLDNGGKINIIGGTGNTLLYKDTNGSKKEVKFV